jgi:hypothetical protein
VSRIKLKYSSPKSGHRKPILVYYKSWYTSSTIQCPTIGTHSNTATYLSNQSACTIQSNPIPLLYLLSQGTLIKLTVPALIHLSSMMIFFNRAEQPNFSAFRSLDESDKNKNKNKNNIFFAFLPIGRGNAAPIRAPMVFIALERDSSSVTSKIPWSDIIGLNRGRVCRTTTYFGN